MAEFKFIVLFNGTSNDDKDQALTNVVKMRDGLSEEFVYCDGVGNDQQWMWMTRWFAQMTGYGAGWVMDGAYEEILEKLEHNIKTGKYQAHDTVNFSVLGFSRGAAMARHFGLKKVHEKLAQEIKQKFDIDLNIKLEAEYLFDTVPSFGIPVNLWLLKKMGIRNQEIDIGWYFDKPKGTKAFHAVSIDERRDAFTPHLLDYEEGETEEVWFEGDHSDVGGGHKRKTDDELQADTGPLRYMVRSAVKMGVKFKEAFLKAINIDKTKDNPLGVIHTPAYAGMPSTQVGKRKMYVKEAGKRSERLPLVSESVLRRANDDYEPKPLLKLENKFCVYDEDGVTHAPAKVLQFSKQKSSKDLKRSRDEEEVVLDKRDLAKRK